MLPESYPITPDDLQATVERQGVELEPGDVVLIRTGWMLTWDEPRRYMFNGPGINLQAASGLNLGHTDSIELAPLELAVLGRLLSNAVSL